MVKIHKMIGGGPLVLIHKMMRAVGWDNQHLDKIHLLMPEAGMYKWTRFRLAKGPFALGKTRRHEWSLMPECSLPDRVTSEWHQHLEDNLYLTP